MSNIVAQVICPICGLMWTIPYPTTEVDCTHHLYCDEGDEPSDCSVTEYNYSGQLGYPFGAHGSNEDLGDQRHSAWGYCSTHSRYVYKHPYTIEISWDDYFKEGITNERQRFMKRG